jgi:hypothetical protein
MTTRQDMLRLGGLLVALLVVVGIVVLAGGGGSTSPSSSGSVRGILVSVKDQELVLQPEDRGNAQTYTIRPTDRERLDLFHLEQHAADQLPSILYYDQVGDSRFVTRVDDAPLQ